MQKLLANENFPASAVALLRREGHNVLFAAESMAGASDMEVMARAVTEKRWVLTFDRDYGELVFARKIPPPPAVVYFRLAHYSATLPAEMFLELIARHDIAGCFVVVESEDFRTRPLPQNIVV